MVDKTQLFYVETKDGAHINVKVNENGSKAGVQFDEGNNLKGPVNLIEVDEDELRQRYAVPEYSFETPTQEKSLGEKLGDAVAEGVAEGVAELIKECVPVLAHSVFNYVRFTAFPWAKNTAFPWVKNKTMTLFSRTTKQRQESDKENSPIGCQLAERIEKQKRPQIPHTSEEVNEIVANLRNSLMYIVVSVNELSRTVVLDDDGEIDEITQEKIRLLSSEYVISFVGVLLQDSNRDKLDQVTLDQLTAFCEKKLIVNGKTVSIEKYMAA